MKKIGGILALCLSVSLTALTVNVAAGRTPAPTPAATVTPSPTWTPWPTATPPLPRETVAEFSGEAWLPDFGGYSKAGLITARIGDTVCGTEPCSMPGCLRIPVDPAPVAKSYHIDVLAAEQKPGCGYEGALVTFFVGDIRASQTGLWHAGNIQEVNLTADPPFAVFQGAFTLAFDPSEPIGIDRPAGMLAYIGGQECGQAIYGIWRLRDREGHVAYRYSVLVRSSEQQPGCGVEGSEVTFKVIWRGQEGNVNVGRPVAVAREKGIWRAWDGSPPDLNLTMVPIGGIGVADVGDAPSQSGEGRWWAVWTAVGAVGLAGVAAGAALRRRTAA